MRQYVVIIERGPNSWGAYAPDLPGLGAAASTRKEVEKLIREGIDFHLGAMLEDGDPIPKPTSRVIAVQTDVLARFAKQKAKSSREVSR
jgi:predicted RNase H-like HicB family nuclease